MMKTVKSIISLLLVMCILSGVIVTALAASDETYLCDLRLIYAEDYEQALLVLKETRLEGYQVLDQNLNTNTGKTGVWLAYQTTSDRDEAITDLAVMQMGGGYSTGNYQKMIQKSRAEYLKMGRIYLEATAYFAKAYRAGDVTARSAYRQLNFYTGLDDFGTKRLGELMVSGALSDSDLATLFLQGNSYVLKNVRSLLAMGVSYNEDGMHYLEKVEASAWLQTDDPSVFAYEDYDELAVIVGENIAVFRQMFEELEAYETELNYEDEEFSDLEIKYSEYKAMAEMMRAVAYLEGRSLYDFCMTYEADAQDYSALYPLVDALNEGQAVMTQLCCYYDVVRYSAANLPEAMIDEEISRLEQTYGTEPVSVYSGIDRSIYEQTFALTARAVRTDAYSESATLSNVLLGDAWVMRRASSSALDVALSVWTIGGTSKAVSTAEAAESTAKAVSRYVGMVRQVVNAIGGQAINLDPFINTAVKKYTAFDLFNDMLYNYDKSLADPDWTFDKLYACFMHEVAAGGLLRNEEAKLLVKLISSKVSDAQSAVVQKPPAATSSWFGYVSSAFSTLSYFLDASLLATAAISLGVKIYDYYHPTYDDIPRAMVDVVSTESGDAYVKYNVVYEAVAQKDGGYSAGDLNAFAGRRWNALYYTKNRDAGKPLLASFVLSHANHWAAEGNLPVHRFGEVVCYDLNKYNFSSASDQIFLSVGQSEQQKSAADIPDVVGSVFGTEFWIVSGCVGVVLGVGATVGVLALLKKRKEKVQ